MNLLLFRKREKYGWRFEIEPENGKRKWISKSGFASKADAQADGYRAIAVYMETGLRQAALGTGTVKDLAETWYRNDIMIATRPSTQYSYRCILDTHVIPLLGDRQAVSVTGADLLEFRNALIAKNLSPQRVNGIMGKVDAMFRYAVAPLGWMRLSPCAGIRPLKVARERIGILSKDEVSHVLDSLPARAPERLPLMIAYYGGLRLSEVFGLQWQDVDFETGMLSVSRQADTVNGAWVLLPPKTGPSVRTISLPPALLDELRLERDRQHDEELVAGDMYIVQRLTHDGRTVTENPKCQGTEGRIEPILRRDSGHMYLKTTFKNDMAAVRKASGLDFHFHQLRHTSASLLLAGGVDAANIASRLGHSTPRITLDVYTHATGGCDSDAAAILSLEGDAVKTE